MSLDYESSLRDAVVSCDFDGCGIESTVEGSFQECVASVKEMGWRILKRGEEWVHLCPDHANETI